MKGWLLVIHAEPALRIGSGSPMSRILVVDDEESICWSFREFLTEEGHIVETAATAE